MGWHKFDLVFWVLKKELENHFSLMQKEISALLETLNVKDGNDYKKEAEVSFAVVPELVMDPKRLVELLQICTIITQGLQHS